MTGQRWGISEAIEYVQKMFPDKGAGFLAWRTALRRGEIEAKAETWGPKERWKAQISNKGELDPIPKEAWEYATIEAEKEDTISWPRRWPYPGLVFDPEEVDYGHGVHVSREDVQRIWPERTVPSVSTATTIMPPRKGVGGAKGDYDWEAYLIDAAAFIYENGVPENQQDVFEYLWDKYGGKEGGPSPASMKKHIGPLIRRLKEADGN